MRHVSKILEGRDIEWIWMCEHFIKVALKVGSHKKERHHWEVVGVLLINNLQITNSPTVRGLLKGWARVARNLIFTFNEGSILRDASIEQLLQLYSIAYNLDVVALKALRIFLTNRGIKWVIDLHADEEEWYACTDIIPHVRSS